MSSPRRKTERELAAGALLLVAAMAGVVSPLRGSSFFSLDPGLAPRAHCKTAASRLSRSIFGAVALLRTSIASRDAVSKAALPPNSGEQVTFNRDIAPIVFHYCVSCHRPGEAGPFPLLTYEDVKKRGHQIAAVTQTRFMPPWLPEPQTLKFADERILSDQQIALIQKWVDEGMPQGNPADLPPKPQFVQGWQLGKPDLIVKAAKPFLLPASGIDTYWNFVLPIPVNETRWVKAVEIRPGDKRLVHHANILVDRLELSRKLETEPGAGFGGMEIRIESELFDPDSHFLFWKPGTVPYVEPDGMALRIDKGTDFLLNTHLQPSGKAEPIQPSIGIYFTDKPATERPMLLQLECDNQLDIPPGDANFVVKDDFALPVDVDLLAIYPHAHYLGKDLEATATLPDGSKQMLIHIKHWDLNWQAVYRYETPVPLPKGTVISMRYVYDNSSNNTANPNRPPQRVKAGNRSTDEMSHLWLQVLPKNLPDSNRDARMLLQEALAQHRVDRDPGDFEWRYNLGAMLQARGDVRGAEAQYQVALQLRPGDATVNNALAGALLASGRVDEAVPHLTAALQARPDYFDAHYNLGQALAAQGNFNGAAEQFGDAVRENPQDADAEANLGSALAQLGELREAKTHFERALQLNPGHSLARENLQTVEQMMVERHP
jgi:tetratricopeptide (TPR) repeat protein/mono/diheme cytochrome c family protein